VAIITISRGSLGLGVALAECLAKELGYPCLGREVAREVAEKCGIQPELMNKKIEEIPSLWERLTSERTAYVVAMQELLAERILDGNLVYHGFAGHLLLKGLPALLRIRVIAPMEVRIPLAMAEQNMDAAAAEAHIKKMDDVRARWTKFVFGVDWQDPRLYDLVLNLGDISVAAACDSMTILATRPELAVTDAARARFRDFALAAKIRLILVTNRDTRSLNLEVAVRDEIAFLKGAIPQDPRYPDGGARFKRQLLDMVMSVDGVKHLTLGVEPLAPPPVD
jgi:cytidylate kinase